MKFALFGNTYQAKKSAHVERLLSILSQHNAEVHICREFYQFLTNDLKISIRHAGVFDGNNFEADMILSIGGHRDHGASCRLAGRQRCTGDILRFRTRSGLPAGGGL